MLGQTTCVLCNTSITEANNSLEHLILRALGGRKKIANFICQKCNNTSGEKWDAALAKSLNPLSLLFQINREGRAPPPQEFKTLSGESIILRNDGTMSIGKPSFQIAESDGNKIVRIQSRSNKEAQDMLKGLSKKYPQINIQDAISQFTSEQAYINSPLHISFCFGGEEAGRSIIKSALGLAFKHGVHHNMCKEATTYLQNKSAQACFGFFYERDLIKNRPSDYIFHYLAVSNQNTNGQLLAYIEFFGAQRIVARLSEYYDGPNIHQAYAIDPVSTEEVHLDFEINLSRNDISDVFEYKKIPPGSMEKAMEIPLTLAIKRDKEVALKKAMDNAYDYALMKCGVTENDVLSEKDVAIFSHYFAEQMSHFLFRRPPFYFFCK